MPLSSLYSWATRLIPKHGHYEDETYIKIWLGYARHQWCDLLPTEAMREPRQSCDKEKLRYPKSRTISMGTSRCASDVLGKYRGRG